MNQRKINKENLKVVSLLIDMLWPELVEKWLTIGDNRSKYRLSDSEIRRRIPYELNIYKELLSYGFDYPNYYIILALKTKKRYKRILRNEYIISD